MLPADVRRKLGINPGQDLTGRIEDDMLLFETRSSALKRLQKRFARKPGEPSAVDELLKERRSEAMKEAEVD